MGARKVRKAVIPAGGWGTRLLPATKSLPKEMLPIVDKPAIQYIVEEAVNSGIEEIIIITGRGKQTIEDHFDRSLELEYALRDKGNYELLRLIEKVADLVQVHYVRQKEPCGLGHAVYCARHFIGDEPFAVLLGDDLVDYHVPCLRQLLDVYEEHQCSVIAVQEVELAEVKRYGIIKTAVKPGFGSKLLPIQDLVEKPLPEDAPSRYAVIGRYVMTPEIFDLLRVTQPGAGREIQLTDALRCLARKEPIYGYLFSGRRYDVGDKLGFLEATVRLALNRDDLASGMRRVLMELMQEIAVAEKPKEAFTSNPGSK